MGLLLLLWVAVAPSAAAENPVEWPRKVFRDGVTNTFYQPQLESWDYDTLRAVCAVAVEPRGPKLKRTPRHFVRWFRET